MIYTEVRNPQWADAAHTTINCEVIFPSVSADFLPFSAMASGDYPHTGKIFESCIAGDFGEVTAYSAPVQTLEQAKAAQSAALNAACEAQIYGGYSSSALGSAHTYPAKALDQGNMVASVTSSLYPSLPGDWSTPFWCADSGGAWAYRMHSAAQIQQAGADGKSAILAALGKNAVLQAQVAAATTVDQVQAVLW